MKIWRLGIKEGAENEISWTLISNKFHLRAQNGTILIRASNQQKARQITHDEFPVSLVPIENNKIPYLTAEQLAPFLSERLSICEFERDDISKEEGLL